MDFKHQQRVVKAQTSKLSPENCTPYENFTVEPTYTLVAKPPLPIRHHIYKFAADLRAKYPGHYYYETDQYHVTLLALGTHPSTEKKFDALTRSLKAKPVTVCVLGAGANPYKASVVVYPVNFDLVAFRQQLRRTFGTVVDYTIHNRIWDELLWIHFMAFKGRPEEQLLADLRHLSEVEIGSYVIREWQIYKTTSKVLAPEASQLITTITV